MTNRGVTQRWRDTTPRWRPAGEDGFDPDRYEVREIPEDAAARFVRAHHYSASWPSTRLHFGLHDGARLVGVVALGVPMSVKVLTNPFPSLVPYTESLEQSRLVLLDEVPANGESWFCAEAFRVAARDGVRGVVAFSDPMPRWRRDGALIKPGHVGIVYQALNFTYCGRGTRRSLVVLPDASVLTARAIAKVTARERGHAGVVSRLVALGATPPCPGGDLAVWLRVALDEVRARRVHHPGNHRYVIRLGRTRAERTRTVIGLQAAGPYPKPELALMTAASGGA